MYMWQRPDEVQNKELFLAGERVRPGRYREVGTGRELHLDKEDILPASLDGRVACYMLVNDTWGQLKVHAVVRQVTT